jgi:hypothetical protein
MSLLNIFLDINFITSEQSKCDQHDSNFKCCPHMCSKANSVHTYMYNQFILEIYVLFGASNTNNSLGCGT